MSKKISNNIRRFIVNDTVLEEIENVLKENFGKIEYEKREKILEQLMNIYYEGARKLKELLENDNN